MKKIIAIYARQSLDKKDSISIETQIEACEKYITSTNVERLNNVDIVAYHDKGYSGKNTERPDFKRLIEDVKRGKVEKIVIYKLDRISRNLMDFTTMHSLFEEHKVIFCSVNETFDTSNAMGRAMLNIAMVFAQMERENTQLRVKDNYYHRIRIDGRWAGGPAPLGMINSRTELNVPTLAINEQEIGMVKYAFENYADRPIISLSDLCKELSELGYRSRRENGKFDNVTIARMLQNPLYCKADNTLYKYYKSRGIKFLNDESSWDGLTSAHIVGKKPGNVNTRKYTTLEEQSIYLTNFEGIIDSDIFIKVQNRLAKNEQLKKNNQPTNMKEFQGLLKCAKCGYAIKMYFKPYLGCYGARQLHCCEARFNKVKFEDLRKQLGETLQSNLNVIAEQVNSKWIKQKESIERIEELNKQIDNLVEMVAMGGETAKLANRKIEERMRKISELEMDDSIDMRISNKLGMDCNTLINWNKLSDIQKRNVCQSYIEKILLKEDGSMDIIWK